MRALSLSAAAALLLFSIGGCSRAAVPTAAPQPNRVTQRPEAGEGSATGARAGGAGVGQAAPRPYNRVVTSDAQTRDGLFKTHRIGSRLLFEIPRDQLGKDQLVVMEIAQTVLGSGYGGQAVGNRVLRWEQRDNRIMLRNISYAVRADESSAEVEAVNAANVHPIIATFPVETTGPNGSLVIDVTRLFTQPIGELGPGTRIPGSIDATRSWVERATPFPDNVNVYSTLTYTRPSVPAASPGQGPAGATNQNRNLTNTIVFSWSFHKLPEVAMKPRLCDDRVGFFSVRYTDFTDRGDRVRERCFITRYRLEPKDPAAYARGELVEPVKPIVYYLDRATPKQWIPYFIEAIESWQIAFEEAGFKNAIIGKVAPDDPDWSPEDARYSVVRWLPSTTENASGPHVNDPRSGEILNAHIQFYQNVQNLQNAWYFTQAAALDPRARNFPLPDSLMGKLLGYVMAHEVGHTLGFQHNMKASSAYPVDSLRSASFLRKWGHTPTLMDYSRFNYVAQPEDNIPVDLLIPGIGPYDKWATKWGYAVLPNAVTPEDERVRLDQWAREQDTRPYLRFSTQGSAGSDPGELTEAVGDQDAVKATTYGIRNIERSVKFLIPATVKPTDNFDDLGTLYGRLVGQWRTELNHVTNIVGGADTREIYGGQAGNRFVPVSRERQKQAVQFLSEKAFKTPEFFLVDEITRKIEPNGSIARVVQAQSSILNSLLNNQRLIRMSEYERASSYGPLEMLRDVRTGIFSELRTREEIDVFRRSLQRVYVESLSTKLNPPATPAGQQGGFGQQGRLNRATPPQLDPKLSDINAAVRADLKALSQDLQLAIPARSGMTRAHLEDLLYRVEEALKRKEEQQPRVTT